MSKSKERDQQLSSEEKELLVSFERGEWKKSKTAKAETAFARRAAKNYFKKDQRIRACHQLSAFIAI